MHITKTSRGFPYIQFKDSNGKDCSLQASSLAEPHIWLGTDDSDDQMHLDVDLVNKLLPFMKAFAHSGELLTFIPGVGYSSQHLEAYADEWRVIHSEDNTPRAVVNVEYLGYIFKPHTHNDTWILESVNDIPVQ